MFNSVDLTNNRDNWEITSDGYRVYSPVLDRSFYGPTLTIARHNRSEAERVSREHHAKNKGD